jgi:multidrug efflux pump subunit AcrA (membrane-fusion protein)
MADQSQSQQQAQGEPEQREPPPPPPPLPSKRAVKTGATIAGGVLLVFLVIGILPHQSQKNTLMKRAQQAARNDSIPEVTVTTVKRGDPVSELSLPGTIEGFHDTPVFARSTGYVRSWHADIGQSVRAGQLLAIIDAPDLDQQLVEARAQAAQARSVLEYARADVERWRVLYRDSVVTKQELDQKQATYYADFATYEAAQAGVARLQELVNFDRVLAPFSGVVTARNVDVGVLVSAGGGATSTNPASLGGATIPSPSPGQQTSAGATSTSSGDVGPVSASASQSVGSSAPGASSGSVGGAGGSLFRISRNDTVRLYIGVPQAYAQGVKPGLNAIVRVREISGRLFNGRVARTAQAFDASTRTLLTEVDIVNSDGLLLPGMYAQTSLKFDRALAPVVLPSGALIVRTQGSQVAAVTPDSVVHLKPIEIDRDLGATLEIDSGLVDGEVVVVNPSDDLRDGQRVRPRAAPASGAAGGQSAGGRPENPPAANDSSTGEKGVKNNKKGSDSDSTPVRVPIRLGPRRKP